MSYKVTQWAVRRAPTADTHERLILAALATFAQDDDGCGCWPAWSTLAEAGMCDRTTVWRKLKALEERGVIARGDQRLNSHIDERSRPTVWDVLMPRDEYGDREWEALNESRVNRGMPALDPASRPSIAMPERARKRRSDKGANRPDKDDVATSNPPDVATSNSQGLLQATDPVATSNPITPIEHTSKNTNNVSNAEGVDATSKTKPDPNANRDDVQRLCDHLADRMVTNGCKRPTITKACRDAARMMLDRDERTEPQVHAAIDWCQSHDFWSTTIHSMSKLRRQYEQLRMQAARDEKQKQAQSRPAAGHQPWQNPDRSAYLGAI